MGWIAQQFDRVRRGIQRVRTDRDAVDDPGDTARPQHARHNAVSRGPFRHGRRRPAIHDFAACTRQSRGWPAFADHDELGSVRVPTRTARSSRKRLLRHHHLAADFAALVGRSVHIHLPLAGFEILDLRVGQRGGAMHRAGRASRCRSAPPRQRSLQALPGRGNALPSPVR